MITRKEASARRAQEVQRMMAALEERIDAELLRDPEIDGRRIVSAAGFGMPLIAEAERLRKHPERLLEEYIHISTGDWWSPSSNLFNLLAPYLITCLQDEGSWPYIRIPPQRLAWKVVPKERDA